MSPPFAILQNKLSPTRENKNGLDGENSEIPHLQYFCHRDENGKSY
jgi:hypothetical protein